MKDGLIRHLVVFVPVFGQPGGLHGRIIPWLDPNPVVHSATKFAEVGSNKPQARHRQTKGCPPSAKSDSAITVSLGRSVSVARELGMWAARGFPGLSRRDQLAAQRGFKQGLSPPVRSGRRPSDRVTNEVRDANDGLIGVKLYRKYIRGYDRLGDCEGRCQVRRLLPAIRTRLRRESKKTSVPVRERTDS